MSPTPAGPASSTGSNHVNGARDAVESAGDTSGLSQTLQGHVDDIRTLIQCGVCIRPLYEPFTLVCGHTFCYTCLTSWFGSGRSNKTCPDCRAPVKSEPSPAYLVRAVVQLFTSRAELLDKGETTAEHIHHQREEAAKIDRDKKNPHPREGGLFKGTFNKARLPPAAPVVDLEDGVVRCPICAWELEEDSNCIQCGYRQDEGSVTDTSDYSSDDLDENSEMTDYLDDEAEDGFNGADDFDYNGFYDGVPIDAMPFDLQHLYEMHRNHYPHQRPNLSRHGITSDDWDGHDVMSAVHDSEDDDDLDDTDMDSFIDDGEHYGHGEYDSESDRSTVVGAPDNSTQDHYGEDSHQYSDIPTPLLGDLSDSSSDSTSDEGDEDVDDIPTSQIGTLLSDSSPIITGTEGDGNIDDIPTSEIGTLLSDADSVSGITGTEGDGDDDDGSEDDEPIRPAVSGNRRRPNTWTAHVSNSPARPWRMNSNGRPAQSRGTSNARNRPPAGSSMANAIRLEDDSDEGPVRPSRRARR
ncbi:hypothetical protein P170DRAFT_505223 [Aspergillus steynii IBT 23096]|uniref:RING-type domain-containing protein n=1 Tax=Aspergillus steynii IBT 23096 TaxID=1392250 RepID=A0A2I2GNK6_9EURO|nr:uncharacterized protein P170DRAFT_505223 [Aspergillus steynii IBT 23096]PLB54465.1 hypothetical protein P170DRAFT_505223 [Aspergillus steynii IBT 23096]